MKKKNVIILVIASVIIVCLLVCGILCLTKKDTSVKGKATVNWDYEPVSHKGYTDLGRYVIDLGTITQEEFAKGLEIVQQNTGNLPVPSCTGIVKRNSQGEVIIGRNLDIYISNCPSFVSHFVGGKYQAIGFSYVDNGEFTYSQFQQGMELPDGFREKTAVAAGDVFNEAGLYIEVNMRTSTGHVCTSTNPGGLRVPSLYITTLVGQNAGTVVEALEFIRNELDIYSQNPSDPHGLPAGWDGSYIIGDATGEYGVIEFSSNQVYYTPYANGHANFYVHPNLYGYNTNGMGFGRLAAAQEAMFGAETAQDMMEAARMGDWRREITDIWYSYKDEQGNVHFEDKDGNPSIDYRTENPGSYAVSEDGHYIPEDYNWTEVSSKYEEFKEFSNNMTRIQNDESKSGDKDASDLSKENQDIEKMAREYIAECHKNSTNEWLTNNDNFEEVKQAYIDYFQKQNAFELMDKFLAGDEQPARDSANLFTTGMNYGVNCNKKYLMVRVQEQDDVIYEYQW